MIMPGIKVSMRNMNHSCAQNRYSITAEKVLAEEVPTALLFGCILAGEYGDLREYRDRQKS
jgi:hypothetical protein